MGYAWKLISKMELEAAGFEPESPWQEVAALPSKPSLFFISLIFEIKIYVNKNDLSTQHVLQNKALNMILISIKVFVEHISE